MRDEPLPFSMPRAPLLPSPVSEHKSQPEPRFLCPIPVPVTGRAGLGSSPLLSPSLPLLPGTAESRAGRSRLPGSSCREGGCGNLPWPVLLACLQGWTISGSSWRWDFSRRPLDPNKGRKWV